MPTHMFIKIGNTTYERAAPDEKCDARLNGIRYKQIDASHPIEDTDGVPLSDQGKQGEPAVQKAIKDSQSMYFKQKGSDGGGKKKPKETGVNPDLDKNHPGGGLPAALHDGGDGPGMGDGGAAADGGDGGGGE